MNTPTLRSELEPLIPELDRALEVVGKAGEIIQRHTKQHDFSFEAGYRKNYAGDLTPAQFWLRIGNDDSNRCFHNRIDSVIAMAESFDPEESKLGKIARLEAELSKLKGEV